MDLKKTAREAPREPGVYIMRDGENRIIYVGKARILRNRLGSYFSGEKDVKTRTLLRHAVSIETIIVKDEYEALLLENTLIKQHSPRYNINLKDGKTYPVIRLSAGPWPRVFRTRHIIDDGSDYYGPFPNIGAMDGMLDIIARYFPLRKCRRLRTRANPCMYYHIGRCAAPCCGRVTEADYSRQVDRVRKLLSGDTAALIAELTAEMKTFSAALRFEQAAQFRNAIQTIEALGETSAVVDFDPQGRDYIAWAASGILATYSVFSMRDGRLTGRELYRARSASDEGESLATFITGYYHGERLPPGQIFIMEGGHPEVQEGGSPLETRFARCESPQDWKTNDSEFSHHPSTLRVSLSTEADGSLTALRQWFREQFSLEPQILHPGGDPPRSRRHHAVMALARQNAEEDLRQRIRERGAGPALDELKTALNLKNRPERIEGFDIAQLDGKHPVASLISFSGGVPDKKNYRRFKLRTVAGVVDDFAAMREAVRRRYSRLIRENRELPDLILVDGGAGQVSAARGVLEELGINRDLAGLAKRDEEIWLPGKREPLRLSRRSEALKVLQRVRDETHRFATALNQKLRSTDLRLEALESVEGIGPRRAALLLRQYGDVKGIAEAEAAEIARAARCGIAAARAVRAAARLSLVQRKSAAAAFAAPGRRSRGSSSAASLAAEALAPDSGEAAAYGEADNAPWGEAADSGETYGGGNSGG
jgi:excinuclease ABC subunit C